MGLFFLPLSVVLQIPPISLQSLPIFPDTAWYIEQRVEIKAHKRREKKAMMSCQFWMISLYVGSWVLSELAYFFANVSLPNQVTSLVQWLWRDDVTQLASTVFEPSQKLIDLIWLSPQLWLPAKSSTYFLLSRFSLQKQAIQQAWCVGQEETVKAKTVKSDLPLRFLKTVRVNYPYLISAVIL